MDDLSRRQRTGGPAGGMAGARGRGMVTPGLEGGQVRETASWAWT